MEVSAIFVANTALRAPGGVGSNTRACWSPGREEYSGNTINSAASVPRPFKLQKHQTLYAANAFRPLSATQGHRSSAQNNKLFQRNQPNRRESKAEEGCQTRSFLLAPPYSDNCNETAAILLLRPARRKASQDRDGRAAGETLPME